jgi:hypothetical protein
VGILKEGHTAQGGRGAHMIHAKGCNMSQNKSREAVAPVSRLVISSSCVSL